MKTYATYVTPTLLKTQACPPALCQSVATILRQQQTKLKRTGGNGRILRTDDHFFHWPEKAISEMAQICHHAVASAVVETTQMTKAQFQRLIFDYHSWAQIEEYGAFLPYETASNCSWRGWLCLDAGEQPPDEPDSGIIVLHDPRINASQALDDVAPNYKPALAHAALRFQLNTGDLLLMPSYVPQEHFAYLGQRPRILVGFRAWIRDERTIPMLPIATHNVREVPLVLWQEVH